MFETVPFRRKYPLSDFHIYRKIQMYYFTEIKRLRFNRMWWNTFPRAHLRLENRDRAHKHLQKNSLINEIRERRSYWIRKQRVIAFQCFRGLLSRRCRLDNVTNGLIATPSSVKSTTSNRFEPPLNANAQFHGFVLTSIWTIWINFMEWKEGADIFKIFRTWYTNF